MEKTGGGLLVEPDDPQSLAEGIVRLSNDPSLAEKLGQHGFQKVREHYSVATMANRALEVYETVLIPKSHGENTAVVGTVYRS